MAGKIHLKSCPWQWQPTLLHIWILFITWLALSSNHFINFPMRHTLHNILYTSFALLCQWRHKKSLSIMTSRKARHLKPIFALNFLKIQCIYFFMKYLYISELSCDKKNLKWIFIPYSIYDTSCAFYFPSPEARGYKTHNSFHKYRMKWKFISDPIFINRLYRKFPVWYTVKTNYAYPCQHDVIVEMIRNSWRHSRRSR